MATLSEVMGQTQIQGVLQSGLEILDQQQEIKFTQYTRTILPLDGYVFWNPGQTYQFKGSLHYSQDMQQSEDETVGFGTVLFTSEIQVETLSLANQNTLFIATAGNFRYAFSSQAGFYTQAGLWHYVGHSIYPVLEQQLLDPPVTVDLTRSIVSNSLPFWLQMNGYAPPYAGLSAGITLYPSFEVAENLPAPYGVVHILESTAIQSVPLRGVYGQHTQLVKDTIRMTLYGLQNNESLDFQDFINQYSLDTDNFGIMNMPVIKDDKRVQPEIRSIAMKKTMDLEISYYQNRSVSVALQLIQSAIPSFYIGNLI